MNLWPTGPCPPTGLLAGDGCDLGQVLLTQCYTGSHIEAEVRPKLQERLTEALDIGEHARAASLLDAFVDTWPVAALVDAGTKLWTERAAAAALPILGRASALLCLAHEWTSQECGPWPVPSMQWMQANIPEGVIQVCTRAQGDGAEALASLTGLPLLDRPWALPEVVDVDAEDLVERRASLANQMVHAQIAAVRIRGVLPQGAPAALALGELRLEGLAQDAYERFGVAGLIAPRAPRWSQLLRPATSGTQGSVLHQTCHTAILPGPVSALAQGEAGPVGWLLWRGPHAPMAVQAEAVALLGALDGARDLDQVAAHLDAPAAVIKRMAAELVRVGAASA